MTSHEYDPFAQSLIEPTEQVTVGNSLRSHGEFMISLGELIDSIRVHDPNEPERTQNSFTFIPELMNEPLVIPASIKYYCDVNEQPDIIELLISKESAEPVCASLEMQFGNKLLLVSRDSSLQNSASKDIVIELKDGINDVTHTIDRVPRRDINALIAHLLTGKDQRTRPELEFINVLSSEACTSLTENLPDYAHSWTHVSDYTFDDGRSLSWVTEAINREEQLKYCRFTYETGQPGRKIVANVDMQQGLHLAFATLENGELETFLPDEGDMLRFQEVIDDLKRRYSDTEAAENIIADSIDESSIVVSRLGSTTVVFKSPKSLEESISETSRPDAQFLRDDL